MIINTTTPRVTSNFKSPALTDLIRPRQSRLTNIRPLLAVLPCVRWTMPPRRNGWFAPPPREMPPHSKSRNPFINGSKTWVRSDGILCVKCGELGHLSNECNGVWLPAWEQSYLKETVFGSSPKANFATAGYGAFDGNVQPYGTPTRSSTEASSVQMTPSSSASSNSVTVGIGGLSVGRA